MSVGKLSNDDLGKVVLKKIKPVRDDILIRPGIGEDCAAIEFGDMACVLTTDPITGSGSNLGKLAVHVCVNDIASSGSVPVALLLTVLCPKDTEKEVIEELLNEANKEANSMGIEIIGGHTELTTAVNRIVVSATAIGKIPKEKLIRTGDAQNGDWIYLTKKAGLEGTAIIATDKRRDLLEILSNRELDKASSMMEQISVLREGLIGQKVGVSAMHDATEGGVIGAIHELCEASGKGCRIRREKISIHAVTEKICDFYHIDPLKLIASGSMVMAVPPERAAYLEKAFLDAGIEYSKVGVVTENQEKIICYGEDSVEMICEEISSPESDELYKVIK
ncbi:MAG: AIR synthase family protein [Clostridia bacterium]|nr:AIR synthase family protein [Clostridia bacterium]